MQRTGLSQVGKFQLIGAALVVITAALVAASPAQSESLLGSSFIGALEGDSKPADAATLPPFSADLPGLVDSPWTVGRGKFEVETSFSVSHDRSTNEFRFPTLLRYGLFHAVEIRLESNLVAIQTEGGQDRSTTVGTNGLSIGFKATIAEYEIGVFNPAIALLARVELPTGALSSSRPKPGGLLIAASDLPANFDATVNIGVDFPEPDDAGDRFEVFRYAVELGYTFPWWEEALGIYAEHSGDIRTGSGEVDAYLFDFGIYYQLAPNMQIDVFAPIGLNSAAEDIRGSVSFSWRI